MTIEIREPRTKHVLALVTIRHDFGDITKARIRSLYKQWKASGGQVSLATYLHDHDDDFTPVFPGRIVFDL